MAVFGGVLAIFLVTQRPPPGVMAVWTAVGLAGVYVANLVRIVAIVAVGHAWGVAALLRAHAQAGWVVFVAWALLFAHLARRHVAATAAPPAVVA
jgi:exosortase/archaeosortase family protein